MVLLIQHGIYIKCDKYGRYVCSKHNLIIHQLVIGIHLKLLHYERYETWVSMKILEQMVVTVNGVTCTAWDTLNVTI
jgi:hypothetical protein